MRNGASLRGEEIRVRLRLLQAVIAVAHAGQRPHRSDCAGKGDGGAAQFAVRRHQLVDDAERVGFGRRHMAPADDQVECGAGTDEARQPLRAAAAGKDADQHFRQAHLRGGAGYPVVARKRVLQSAAQRKAVDCRHDRLARRIDAVAGALADRRPDDAGAELADVGAGNEGAPRSDQHDRDGGRVGLGAREGGDDAVTDAGSERVHGGIVDDHDRDLPLLLQPHHFNRRHVGPLLLPPAVAAAPAQAGVNIGTAVPLSTRCQAMRTACPMCRALKSQSTMLVSIVGPSASVTYAIA